jgi:hypothetical protein
LKPERYLFQWAASPEQYRDGALGPHDVQTLIRFILHGLEYNSIKRNPEALLLYQRHSTFLKSKRQDMKSTQPTTPTPHDPFMSYKKPKLVIHLREEMQRRQEVEAQYTLLLEEFVQKDILIAKLQAKIAENEEYLGRLRIEIQREEHGEQ